jgi:ubiquinone/menaquinone biosynthesis C-methylase UbiE
MVMPNHKEIYATQAEKYEALVSKQPDMSEVIRQIQPFEGLDVVDLGAGSGRLSAAIAAEARSLVCTDLSGAMLDFLDRKLGVIFEDKRNWSTIVADHRSLPIDTSSIDLVVSGWSISYLANTGNVDWRADLSAVLAEIARILRPGGTTILLETLGTGCETPAPPAFLLPYYRALMEEYGFFHKWIRADYRFDSVEEAVELAEFFFGDRVAEKVIRHGWSTLSECAGVWWRG